MKLSGLIVTCKVLQFRSIRLQQPSTFLVGAVREVLMEAIGVAGPHLVHIDLADEVGLELLRKIFCRVELYCGTFVFATFGFVYFEMKLLGF